VSQLSQLLSGQISVTQFITDVEGDVAGIAKTLEGQPAVQTALTGLSNAATTVATDGVTWAETALSGVATNLATDLEGVVNKYLPQVFGAGTQGQAVTAGSVTLAQQFGQLLIQLAEGAAPLIIKAL
jgi:hypothetical protein